MIREASAADLPEIERYGRAFHEAAGQPFGFDAPAASAFAQGLIDSPSGVVLVNGSGMIGGALSPAYCAPSWVMAVELFWWAESGGMALLRAFEQWAEDHGAHEVRMTSLASLPRADALLRRKKYMPAEISYRKVL